METANNLVGLIYDAVADGTRWPLFLNAFVRAVRATRAGLLLCGADKDEFAAVCWVGWSDDDIQLYGSRYGAIDPWRIGSARKPEGEVGSDLDACSREELETSVAFREFYSPRDCIYGMGGTILVRESGQSTITAARGAADGPFEPSELALLQDLMPHLKRAAILHGQFDSMRRQITTFADHLDQYPHGFLLLDAECRVLYANSAARAAALQQDGISIELNHAISMPRQQNSKFRTAISKVATGSAVSPMRVELQRPSGRHPYRLVLSLTGDSGAIPLGTAVPAVSVIVIETDSPYEPNISALRELYSLTPAEAKVAGKLSMGRSIEEIASESKTSVETVRTHLKRTLSKTATYRQGELISLVLRTVPFTKG